MTAFEPSNPRVKGRRVNVYDVARAAGVSHQTVSNTINNPSSVRPATRDKVLAAIRELGYEANAAARSLGVGRSSIVGLEVPRQRPGATGGFIEHFIVALAEAARARNHNVLIFAADRERGTTEHERLHRARLVDGVVITDTTLSDTRIGELISAQVPFVAFGRTAEDLSYPWVDVDNRLGMRLALDRLIGAHHHRIGYVGPTGNTYYGSERVAELQRFGQDGRIEWNPRLVLRADEDPAATRQLVGAVLSAPTPPTAFVAGSDYLAATVVDVARHVGIPVGPEGLAIVGFDDTPLTALSSPSITTIRQPVELVATHVIDVLLDVVADGTVGTRLLEPELVPRESA